MVDAPCNFMYDGETMPRSLSILSLTAALGLAGAAMAQDTTTKADTAGDTATQSTDADKAVTDTTTTDAKTADPATTDETVKDDAAATDEALPTGTEEASGEPAVYVKETFGDWNLRCFRNANGEDPCQLYQLLKEAGGNPVAEFSVFRIEGQAPAVAGATAIVPLVTLLPEELKLSVDGANAKSYPYRVCTQAGCVAQMGLTADDIASFKKGKSVQMVLVPAQAPDQRVKIDISLSGFTAGYDALGVVPK